MKSRIAWAFAIFLCTACVLTPYQPPKGDEPAAVLSFRNLSNAPVNFWLEMNAERCTKTSSVDSLFHMTSGAAAEIKVRAAQDFSISAQQFSAYGLSQQMCVVYATFRPEAGGRYATLFGGNIKGCTVSIVREVTEAGKINVVPEPTFRLRKRVTPLVTEAYCE